MFYSHLRRILPYRLSKLKTFIVGFMISSLCLGLALPPHQASAQSQCTVGCKATVPPIAQQNTPVTFASETTSEGCAVTPGYEWDFGDGSPRQSLPNTTYNYPLPGIYNWKLTSSAARIDTAAGGYGENAPAKQASFTSLADIAIDPRGRGFYTIDSAGSYLVRFVNTTNGEVVIGGQKIAAGAVQRLVGGGLATQENTPGRQFETNELTSLAVGLDGEFLYMLDANRSTIFVFNASGGSKTLCGKTVDPGNVIRYNTQNLASAASALAINPVDGELYLADATSGINKIYRVSCGALIAVAGNGVSSRPADPFIPGEATAIPLLQPRSIIFDHGGNLYIADTGHARVIKVDTSGDATLVSQFPFNPPQTFNPFPNALAFAGNELYVALGNLQTIVGVGSQQSVVVAGTPGRACTYTSTDCGDGGAAASAGLSIADSVSLPPAGGLAGDANGLLIPDQGSTGRGRIRYLNLSANAVTMLGATIAPGRIDTVAGSGLRAPFDGGPAIGGELNFPAGVAVDASGNLFITDTLNSKLRFVNRGATAIKLFEGTPAEQTVQPGHIVTLNKNVGSAATDGVPVIQAGFDTPQGLKTTRQGLLIADSKKGLAAIGIARRTGLIRFLNTTSEGVTFYPNSVAPIVVPPGNVATIAGGSANGSHNGDGQFATSARFLGPTDVAVHPTNKNLYVASAGDKAVRKIDGLTGAVSSLLLPQSLYTGVAFDKEGRLHVTDLSNGFVLRETASGSGVFARMNPESQRMMQPRGVVVDESGNAYVSETSNLQTLTGYPGSRIARISPDGQVSTVAGRYEPGFEGDGGAALNARVNPRPDDFNIVTVGNAVMLPSLAGLAIGADGELFFADARNNRIRVVTGLDTNCSQTGRITVGGNNPVPTITGMTPSTARTGSAAFRLTVLGRDFVPESKIRWNGSERPTTRISSTQLQAEIPASDLTTAGDINVTVFSPAPGGGNSAPRVFVVQPSQNPVPVLQNLDPAFVLAGAPAFTLTVRGERFTRDSIIRWGTTGGDLRTTYISDKELTAVIPADFVTKPLSIPVAVFTPTPGGGVSARLSLVVRPNSEPKLASLDPLRVFANSLAGTTYEITANGEAFVQTSSVLWNGVARPARFVSDKQLKFTITNEDVKQAGGASVSISNADSGGGVSNPLSFTILASPEIRALNPVAVRAGGAGFTLGISGRNFTQGVEASIGGKLRRTAFINTAELQVAVEAEDIVNPGLVSVVVLSGVSGQLPRGVSNAVNLQVVNTAGGNLTSVSAASFASGPIAPDSIVAAFGTGLAAGTDAATTVPLPTSLRNTRLVVKDSTGTERDAALFFVSPTQINYLMPAGTANGVATVTVISDGTTVASGIAEIAQVVPALFTANATGEGLVSGVALRVGANGAPSFEPILSFDQATQKFVATPVDLGAATDQVYLIFFGTGFRNRSALTAVKAQASGEDVAVSFAGAAPGLFGVDQINLGPLPRTLAGRGTINIVVMVDGKPANTVQLAIK